MSKLVLDAELRSKLNGLNAAIEVCDESGETIGHFLPEDEYRRLVIARYSAQLTDEKIKRLRAQSGGKPLAEIWKRLGQA